MFLYIFESTLFFTCVWNFYISIYLTFDYLFIPWNISYSYNTNWVSYNNNYSYRVFCNTCFNELVLLIKNRLVNPVNYQDIGYPKNKSDFYYPQLY